MRTALALGAIVLTFGLGLLAQYRIALAMLAVLAGCASVQQTYSAGDRIPEVVTGSQTASVNSAALCARAVPSISLKVMLPNEPSACVIVTKQGLNQRSCHYISGPETSWRVRAALEQLCTSVTPPDEPLRPGGQK